MKRPALAAIALTLAMSPLTPTIAQDLIWTRQAGTPTTDEGNAVAVDPDGNMYVAGSTGGSFEGPNLGAEDAFLAKYSPSGVLLWTRQIGTPASDVATGVAVDGGGNAYVTGATAGDVGNTNAGFTDAFLAKYDAPGNLLWTRMLGTSEVDAAHGVACTVQGIVYLTGSTRGNLDGSNAGFFDAFVVKYTPTGTLLWKRQIGTSTEDVGYGVAADHGGNVYITGYTNGNLAGNNSASFDSFLAKYNPAGTLVWKRQVGTSTYDAAYGVAVDGVGNAYICGRTRGDLGGSNAGAEDAFLAKYNSSGTILWMRQLGTAAAEACFQVALDSAGSAYITGSTAGGLGGPNAGGSDAFLAKFDASGTPLWTRQIGSTQDDMSYGVAVDRAGNAYIGGSTAGALAAPNAGLNDYFLAKFGISPCPADFNHDGFVTGDDFDSFSLVFIAGDAAADFDHNGFVTGDDFDAYVAAFEAGC